MSSTPKPLQRELSELITVYPIVNAALRRMYDDLNDPNYDGDPTETLLYIKELLEVCENEEYFPDVEDETSDVLEVTRMLFAPEDFDSFSGDDMPGHTTTVDPEVVTLLGDPDFSKVLREAESSLAKSHDSGEEVVAGGPKIKPRWVRRKLVSARRTADRQPKRLGPNGTWVNEPDDEQGGAVQTLRTQTTVVGANAGTSRSLRREATLTD